MCFSLGKNDLNQSVSVGSSEGEMEFALTNLLERDPNDSFIFHSVNSLIGNSDPNGSFIFYSVNPDPNDSFT